MKKLLLLLIIIVIVIVAYNYEKIEREILIRIYPIQYSEYVEQYCNEYDLETSLVYAIIKTESNFNSKAVSNKGAGGLMQLMYPTAKDVAVSLNLSIDEKTMLNPKTNINLGTNYISLLIAKYGNLEVALAAYNAGTGNVDYWIKNNIIKADGSNIENLPYKETNNYVRRILRDYKIYKKLYG